MKFTQRHFDQYGDTVFENEGQWELDLYLDIDTFVDFVDFQYLDDGDIGKIYQNPNRQFSYNAAGRIGVKIRLDQDDNKEMVYFVKLRTPN